ncbi:hypothetical protein B0J12DRAFT_606530 [Macrophomina phaseolina]|uniref:Cellobiose dehydrogenase-like cytochrome domain-containing protein n=1 Tax=Macrophomina phaseolina TaxID=35725 RepID=A0ABQ8G039_9PEZI|nr:hypothetical protein B0J12DRAFT_606530 [Macrophomina phaseolina]
MWSRVATAALLGLASIARAQTSSNCNGNICYALNIPESTANSGNGDIFFQITAPTSYSWVGLGQGSSMSGSHIFVMYTSTDGNNVTVSPRLGTGHNLPQFNSDTQITLLEGSGVSNGQMTANVRCGNCQSWSGGSMDFTASSATWIHASRSGSAMNTDDTNTVIQQHGEDYGSFDWDFGIAKGGSDVNPFVSGNATLTVGTSTGTQDSMPQPSSTASGSDSSSGTSTSAGTQDCVPQSSSIGSGSGSSSSTSTSIGTQDYVPRLSRTGSRSSSSSSTSTAPWPLWRTGKPNGYPWWNNDNKRSEGSDDGVNYCAPGQAPGQTLGSLGAKQTGSGDALAAAAQREKRMQTVHAVLACLAMVILV